MFWESFKANTVPNARLEIWRPLLSCVCFISHLLLSITNFDLQAEVLNCSYRYYPYCHCTFLFKHPDPLQIKSHE